MQALFMPRLRSAVARLVEVGAWLARVPPSGLKNPLDGPGSDALPVILVHQPDADEPAVHRTVAAIPVLSTSASVRVVLILDRPWLATARNGGVAVELLPDQGAFERRHPGMAWSELVERRLALLRTDYSAAAMVRIPRAGLDPADVPALANSLRSDAHLRRSRVFWRRRLAALVAAVDPPARHAT
jgi:hypothetical protein